MNDEEYMKIAYKQAQKALKNDEVPIGAIIVKNDIIIAKAYNKRNKSKLATHHAEILAIEKACKKQNDWRLDDCTIYVTLEPCAMCSGAIANARIKRLVFGAYEKSSGQGICEQIISDNKRHNSKTLITKGVYEEKCSNIISSFFKTKGK